METDGKLGRSTEYGQCDCIPAQPQAGGGQLSHPNALTVEKAEGWNSELQDWGPPYNQTPSDELQSLLVIRQPCHLVQITLNLSFHMKQWLLNPVRV